MSPRRKAFCIWLSSSTSTQDTSWDGAIESHLGTELVVDALQMAIWRRKPALGLVHHSDQGVQYTPFSFRKRLKEVGITPSMGTTGSALDNALAESFISTLKDESW